MVHPATFFCSFQTGSAYKVNNGLKQNYDDINPNQSGSK